MEVSGFSGPSFFCYWQMFFIPSISLEALVPIEGMMNIKSYLPLKERRVFRESANLHLQVIFQHSSAHCRKTKIITQYFEKMKIKVLEWFGKLPDLNSTTNLWSVVKNRWRKVDCTTKMKLIQFFIHVWSHNDEIKNTGEKLLLSIKKK